MRLIGHFIFELLFSYDHYSEIHTLLKMCFIIITFISHTSNGTVMVKKYKYDKKGFIILYEYKKTIIKQIFQVEKKK